MTSVGKLFTIYNHSDQLFYTTDFEGLIKHDFAKCVCMCIYVCVYIQGVSGGIVNILGGGSMDYSE